MPIRYISVTLYTFIYIMENNLEISDALIEWYKGHKRELPWRETTNPYVIWISEIILQQTRVAQGLDYFLRFVKRFPDVKTLALAEEDEVLKYWQGLGYYSRARNLQAAARMIMEQFGGVFPSDYKNVLSLKGIGEYTAAAIVSFAWNQPYPVVDGNVYRVLSRLFGIDTPIDSTKGKKDFLELAGLLINPQKAGEHNQAIMEFGALQCVPQNPDCEHCPLNNKCMVFASGKVQAYPVKQNKTKTKARYFHYLHIEYNGQTFLHRRGEGDIWTGLYEFPLIETDREMDFAELQKTEMFQTLFKEVGQVTISTNTGQMKHILSHQTLYTTFYKIKIEKMNDALRSYLSISFEDIEKYAIPRLIHIYVEKLIGNLFE